MVELKAPGSIFSFAALLRVGGDKVGVACLLGVVWLPKGFPPSDEAWVSVTVVCDGVRAVTVVCDGVRAVTVVCDSVRAVTGVCDGVRVVIGPGLLKGDSRADNPCSADSHLQARMLYLAEFMYSV